jgi:hypothetical protein
MAQSSGPGMSALAPLLGAKQTFWHSDAPPPERGFGIFARSGFTNTLGHQFELLYQQPRIAFSSVPVPIVFSR